MQTVSTLQLSNATSLSQYSRPREITQLCQLPAVSWIPSHTSIRLMSWLEGNRNHYTYEFHATVLSIQTPAKARLIQNKEIQKLSF